MNTGKPVVRILCYGDSNTWGKVPGSKRGRYLSTERWTGILQQKLGEGFEIIEEGLNSRTTNLDDPDPNKPGRNGLQLLMPILESHYPFDILILMLGTNDLKKQYDRTAEQVAESVRRLMSEVDNFSQKISSIAPNVLLIAPPHIDELVADPKFAGGEAKSKALAPLYQQIAHQITTRSCLFLNAAQHTVVSNEDGVHLTKEGHQRLAEAIYLTLAIKK